MLEQHQNSRYSQSLQRQIHQPGEQRNVTIRTMLILATMALSVFVLQAIAQSPVPFSSWPALYGAAENAVVKTSADDTRLYVRIGWGPCLVIFRHELNEAYTNVPADRYINLRDYASARVNPPDQHWTAEDTANCPDPPMQVKPYWRGTRPTYERVLNAEGNQYVRGDKSIYRVSAVDPTPSCEAAGVFGEDAYHVLSPDTELLYGSGSTMPAGEIAYQLVAVCEAQDVRIEDYVF